MNRLMDIFYFSIISATLLLSALGLWFTIILPGIDRWSKRFFLTYFSIFLVCCFFALLEIGSYYFHIPGSILYGILFLESLFLSTPLPMLTVYLLHCCGEDLQSSRLMLISASLCAAFFVVLGSSLLLGVFTYNPETNLFCRGPMYPLLLLPMIAILLLNLAGTIHYRTRMSRKTFLSFLVAILPMLAALLVLLFVDFFPLFDISFVLSGLSMYGLIVSDRIELDLRHQREMTRQQLEIANQRASIMVLQMRPHFIYNTMTSIYSLCDQDSQLARRVIMDFTSYLRKNFTAIASSTPIPFTSELEHVRAYLAVECALYEDSLFVEYDTPHIWFRVPPLTLQPLVENAVKHGRDPYAGPFHISIRTRKTDTGSEITVSDNGRGFGPCDDDAPHIAIKNIEQRLEIMCGGTMTIAQRDGGGTVVTLTIPDSDESAS